MKYDFHPYIGAGPLRFGMTAHEITRILGAPNTTEICREYPEQIGVYEYAYDEEGIYVYFSKDSGVDSISFTNNVINFAGMNLRTVPIRSLREWVWEYDCEVEFANGFDFCSFRFGFWAFSLNANHNPETPAKVITIFRRGYVEDMRAAINLMW